MNKTDLLQNFTLTEVLIFSKRRTVFFVFQKSLFVELSGALVSPIFVKTSNPTPKFLVQLVHILKLKVKCTSPLAIDCSINNLALLFWSLCCSQFIFFGLGMLVFGVVLGMIGLSVCLKKVLTVTMMLMLIMIMTITITQWRFHIYGDKRTIILWQTENDKNNIKNWMIATK